VSKVYLFASAVGLACALGVGSPAFAQSASASPAAEITPGRTEVVGFVGRVTDGGGTLFGGGLQFAMSPRLLLVPEVGFLTLGQDYSGVGFNVDSSAIQVSGNAHYVFASRNAKVMPYALGGIGFLRISASASAGTFSGSVSDSTIGVNIGGGLRWQAGDKWGVRPELKVFIADGSNVQFTGGIYYRFGS
jgi:opacity protein-like surface antigen